MLRTTTQSLIWKEWHEQKWKLASVFAVLLGATSLTIFATEGEKFESAFGMMSICVVPLAVFVGLGMATSEQSRNTLGFLQSQPIRLRQVALIKLAMSLLTLIVPIILTALSFFGWKQLLELLGVEYSNRALGGVVGIMGNFYVDVALYCSLIAGSLVIWFGAISVNRSDEVSGGAFSLCVIGAWVAVVLGSLWFADQAGVRLRDHWGEATIFALIPCGSTGIIGMPFNVAEIIFAGVLATILHLVLAAYFVMRFGETKVRPVTSPKVATFQSLRTDWLGSPRQSVWTAIAWKQFRECLPIALVGIGASFATTVFFYVSDSGTRPVADVYGDVSMPLGFCVALVMGIAVAINDVNPQINTFWRSRPIDPNQWFWAKFVIGIVVVLAATFLPLWVLDGITGSGDNVVNRHLGVMTAAAIHLAIYTAAVAMTCLFRNAVYAAILSIGVLTMCLGIAWLAWNVPYLVGAVDSLQHETESMLTGLFACIVLSTLAGWLAMRNDWGLKARY